MQVSNSFLPVNDGKDKAVLMNVESRYQSNRLNRTFATFERSKFLLLSTLRTSYFYNDMHLF